MLYRAEHWTPSKTERCKVCTESRKFGTREAAEQWARSSLEPIVTTRALYHEDLGKAAYANIYRIGPCSKARPRYLRKSEAWINSVEPQVEIVPSVGELGYW